MTPQRKPHMHVTCPYTPFWLLLQLGRVVLQMQWCHWYAYTTVAFDAHIACTARRLLDLEACTVLKTHVPPSRMSLCRRVCLTDGKTPELSDVDSIHKLMHESPPNSCYVFNCQQGKGRTTIGMVLALLYLSALVRFWDTKRCDGHVMACMQVHEAWCCRLAHARFSVRDDRDATVDNNSCSGSCWSALMKCRIDTWKQLWPLIQAGTSAQSCRLTAIRAQCPYSGVRARAPRKTAVRAQSLALLHRLPCRHCSPRNALAPHRHHLRARRRIWYGCGARRRMLQHQIGQQSHRQGYRRRHWQTVPCSRTRCRNG